MSYQARIGDAIRLGNLWAEPGEITHVEIEHGFGCRKIPCTCHPRITAVVGDEIRVIGTGGAILERWRKS
ncbi:hypothetical protein FQY83_02945 [Luteimonas marina]|uniref:Uncharacterized protein n=1 Tax=Luteimonas marina TaxID=488485 RepID=A0A5C5UDB8_9GAMM|nr:hypothetical protein [Luteimonas marina]TWT23602.1 hypothetical protein FQY83_02945 [Luteimonas marina]